MGLNIKNEETCRLARELAQLTGESMTERDYRCTQGASWSEEARTQC